ncbi:Oidioi.mRNA.OKI2018_I69.XSR.g16471.t1.cds [Oikopleura dioica]|uniref:Oidioi.mRNA.OKI2018_I69.XSR.g16471.t1.cds n=1 Tax=Oikopleura dioica TaxID=34765 RepID=A0ABN7SLA8_OIKDI|nr:Oidioi.mRNA.OKI2018_I69.XSR.g16471.t1.cds [Oikopleura dioica]
MEKPRPGKIDEWNPAPEYIAENEPSERKIVFHSSREKRMSLARAEAAKESISEIVAQPWEKFFEDEEQIASRLRKSSTREKLSARASRRSSSENRQKLSGSNAPEGRSSAGPFLRTAGRNLIPSSTSDLEVYSKSPRRNSSVTVVFDFQARNERELSVSRNDKITVDEVKNEQWAQCRKGSMTGMVPLSYLRSSDRSSLTSVSSPSPLKKGSAVAAFDLEAKSERHLRLTKGETLELTSKIDKNWYEGQNSTGASGIIPANYLTKIVEPIQPAPKARSEETHANDEVFEEAPRPSKSEKIRQNLKDELDLAMKELSSHLRL